MWERKEGLADCSDQVCITDPVGELQLRDGCGAERILSGDERCFPVQELSPRSGGGGVDLEMGAHV